MRVAVLNDIEGNLAALGAVFAEVEDAGVGGLSASGDVVTGPFPAAGSVVAPFERPRGAYQALLGPAVELRRTDYDVGAAVDSIRAAGGQVDEELLGQLLEPPDREETTARFEAARNGA